MSNIKLTNLNIQIALALSAASALIYEVVAINILFFYFIESSYSTATVLAVFLSGLGLGSFLIHTLSHKIKNKELLFGILQILISVYAFFVLTNLTKIIPQISTLGVFMASCAVLLVPTVFLGAIFPLAGSIFIKQKKEIIGLVYSSDLAGAILGALIAGFFLIPTFGNRIAVLTGAGLNLLSAFIIFPKTKKAAALIPGIVFLIFSVGFPSERIKPVQETESAQEREPVQEAASEPEDEYQFYANSPYGVVRVEDGRLLINERGQCGYVEKDDISEKLMVDYALNSFDPLENKELSILNIGLGCGGTLSRILEKTNEAVSVDVVEINPRVVEANRKFTDVLKNPRVNLIIDDGLHYLRETEKQYDSILIDIEEPAAAHSSDLYTVEAFKIVNDSLAERGTFALWHYRGVPPHLDQNIEYLDILFYSLKETFPFVYLYPDVFLASTKELEKEEYVPSGHYKINTIDKKILSQVYQTYLAE